MDISTKNAGIAAGVKEKCRPVCAPEGAFAQCDVAAASINRVTAPG